MMPIRMSRLFVASAAFAVAVASFVGSASADFIGSYITIEATNSNGTASYSAPLPTAAALKAQWALGNTMELRGGPNNDVIATIDDLEITLDGDPQVILNFAVTAGASDTNFTISSAVVSFPTLNNPLGKATTAMTLTDNNLNGAALTVKAPNVNGMYRAMYNGSVIFTEEIGNISIGGGSTSADNGNPPFVVIPAAVSSIQSNYSFTLSSLDSASGTSNFTVLIPEPASLVLLSMGCIAMLRRR